MAELTADQAVEQLRTLPENRQRGILARLLPEVKKAVLAKLDFSVKQPGMETQGLFKMMSPAGEAKSIPYGRVMEAAQTGYKIDPEDYIAYAKGREAELKKTGQKLNIASDLPPAYTALTAAPRKWSPAWLKQQALNVREKALGLLPTVGGMAGGLVGGGATLESGPGMIAGATLGAGAGGALMEATRQQIEEELHPYEAKMTPKEAALGIGKEAAVQAGSELTGRLGARALAPAVKYFQRTADLSRATGIPLLPSEAAGRAPSYIEKFLKGSVMTSGKMERFRAMQNAQTQAEVQKIADSISRFHGTSEDLGKLVQQGIEVHKQAFRATQDALYEAIGADVGEQTVRVPVHTEVPSGLLDASGQPLMKTVTTYKNVLVDRVMPSTAVLKKFAAEELQKLDQAEQILDPNLLSQSRTMLQTIVDAPDRITYKAMAAARSDALAKAREFDQALAGKQAGLAKKMANLFDESLMDAAEKSGIPDLADKIRAANAYTASEHRMFEQQLVEKVVKTKSPEGIATLLRGRMIGNQELRDLFTVMPKELHPSVQRQLLLDTMRQSTNRISGVFNERRFAETIGNLGDERGKIIFGNNWSDVKEISKLLEKVNGPTGLGGGTGAALQNLSVIRDILAAAAAPAVLVAKGHLEAGTLTIAGEIVGFRTMANLLTHPGLTARLLKAFQVGLRIAPYAATGAYAASKDARKSVKELRDQAMSLMQPKPQPAYPTPATEAETAP